MGDKNELVKMLGSRVAYSWIGLRKGTTGRLIWSDGRGTPHFTKWLEDEPNNSEGNELCVEMNEDGLWNDISCGEDNGFACYEGRQDGVGRYMLYFGGTNWVNSQEQCRSKHTDLAFISTESDNSVIAEVTGKWKKNVWIGLFYDTWMWSDGRETSFRYWLSGSENWGDCASVAVSQQGRWVGANCDAKATFVCQGGLKVKRMVIRMTVSSDVDFTDSTVSDAFLKKLETGLRQQQVTDFNLSWRSDNNGLIFQRHEQLEVAETGC
ncbi:macrophage mannose receptor 1-like [Sebastes fasciatus]|uniref:macrophage mannose receptor 1-like n=1 Tax=Sebastes fasciatus TaxID=394691 RepID=UPI003D9E12D9